MAGFCAEQHKLHPSHQLLKKCLPEIDIPPRKIHSRRPTTSASSIPAETTGMFLESPKTDETHLQQFLPYNGSDDDDADRYSSDHFRIFEFKVRRCTRSRSHDWTDCPFAHPGEKARRRDPRLYQYSGTICSEFRRGSCSRRDNCEFAHGVFESWLHPDRYRTEACKDGKNCKRKVCFFAHSPRQLRVLPSHCHDNSSPVTSQATSAAERTYHISNHSCLYCHSVNASPTSTLKGVSHFSPPMSPSLSPPVSPVKSRFSSISRCMDHRFTEFSEDELSKLLINLEAMKLNEALHDVNLSWVDVSLNGDGQPQFILSPSTPSPSGCGDILNGDSSSKSLNEYKICDNGLACPDLGWVNDLLT